MSHSNEVWDPGYEELDPEARFEKLFDPADMSRWLEYPPEEFIAIMVHELKMWNVHIAAYTEVLEWSPQFKAATMNVGEEVVALTDITETISKATKRVTRLLDTVMAYRREKMSD